MNEYIKIKLIKSKCGTKKKLAGSFRGLGLKKVGHVMTLKNTPETRGMIKKIINSVEVLN